MDQPPNPHPKKLELANSSSQPRPKIYHCTECDRKFDRPSLLSQHVLVHTGERPHLCSICGVKCFSRSSNLYRHMRICKGRSRTSSYASIPEKRRRSLTQSATSGGESPLQLGSSNTCAPPDSNPVSLEPDRSLDPDPTWGPVPLASWQPQRSSFNPGLSPTPMPIAMPVHLATSSLSLSLPPVVPHVFFDNFGNLDMGDRSASSLYAYDSNPGNMPGNMQACTPAVASQQPSSFSPLVTEQEGVVAPNHFPEHNVCSDQEFPSDTPTFY